MTTNKTSKPWYKKWWAITLFVFFVLIVIGTLADNDNSTNQQNNPATQEQEEKTEVKNEPITTPTKEEPKKSAESSTETRCEDVPTFVVESIASGLNTEGITLRNVQAVKSNDFNNVYFISADLQGPGLEGENDIVTFTRNNLESSSLTLSVDAVANEFFVWPLGKNTDANVTMNDDGAQESRDCVNQ